MASFETLLIKVRSETPTSFFFVVSNVAFLMFGLLLPGAPPCRPDGALFAAFSPFGRRLIPYIRQNVSDSTDLLWHIAREWFSPSLISPRESEVDCFRMRRGLNAVASGFLYSEDSSKSRGNEAMAHNKISSRDTSCAFGIQ